MDPAIITGAAAPRISIVTFTVPPSLLEAAKLTGKPQTKTFSLRLSDMNDEDMASDAAGNNAIKYQTRLAMSCLVKVDGEKIPQDGLAAERVLSAQHPAIRNFIITAYITSSGAPRSNQEVVDFLSKPVYETLD